MVVKDALGFGQGHAGCAGGRLEHLAVDVGPEIFVIPFLKYN